MQVLSLVIALPLLSVLEISHASEKAIQKASKSEIAKASGAFLEFSTAKLPS
jgi:hypothetical protein